MNDQEKKKGIFERMQAGEPIRKDDPDYDTFQKAVSGTIQRCVEMNATATDVDPPLAFFKVVTSTPPWLTFCSPS